MIWVRACARMLVRVSVECVHAVVAVVTVPLAYS